jgi:hypothetical protein
MDTVIISMEILIKLIKVTKDNEIMSIPTLLRGKKSIGFKI